MRYVGSDRLDGEIRQEVQMGYQTDRTKGIACVELILLLSECLKLVTYDAVRLTYRFGLVSYSHDRALIHALIFVPKSVVGDILRNGLI